MMRGLTSWKKCSARWFQRERLTMIDLNQLTAVIAIILGALVVRGYAPSVIVMSHDDKAKRYLVTATVLVFFAILGRLAQWDVAIPLLHHYGANAEELRMIGNLLNGAFWNVLVCSAAILGLKALVETLDPSERQHYNILTIAFYPKRLLACFTFTKDNRE